MRAVIAAIEAQNVAMKRLSGQLDELLVEVRSGFASLSERMDGLHVDLATHTHDEHE